MNNLSREKLSLLILVILLFISGTGILIWQGFENNRIISSVAVSQTQVDSDYNVESNLQTMTESKNEDSDRANNLIEDSKIIVHVAGEVVHPGVYEFSTGSRVVQAIEAAGGATSLANLDSINLALPIDDGQKVYIPSVVDKLNQIKTGSGGGVNTTAGVNKSSEKININTASVSKLLELSGIGPSKADSIVDYRDDNGPFKSVDDLLKVSGIGDKTLTKIRDDIVAR